MISRGHVIVGRLKFVVVAAPVIFLGVSKMSGNCSVLPV
jgi:hypothetical protein